MTQHDICTRLRAAMYPARANGNPDSLLEEAANAIAELRAVIAWRPMVNAPKDGTEIIVFAPRAGTVGALIAHWGQDLSGEYQPSYANWFYWTGHDFTQICKPVAWMPLPAEQPL